MDVQRSYVLQSLLLDFVKRFVQVNINSWYNELTIDASFGDKVVHVLMKSIDELQRRLQNVEWANFVCIDMVSESTGLVLSTADYPLTPIAGSHIYTSAHFLQIARDHILPIPSVS